MGLTPVGGTERNVRDNLRLSERFAIVRKVCDFERFAILKGLRLSERFAIVRNVCDCQKRLRLSEMFAIVRNICDCQKCLRFPPCPLSKSSVWDPWFPPSAKKKRKTRDLLNTLGSYAAWYFP